MHRSLGLLAAVLLAFAPIAHADDTLRCNSALVSVNDYMPEVLRKCGEPASRGPVSYIRVVDPMGRRATVPVEQWTYGPNSGMYHYLRFEGERLVNITGDRG